MTGPSVGTHNKAKIVGIIGASGTGKGHWLKTQLLPARTGPAVIWSPLEETDQYADLLKAVKTREIQGVIEAWKAGRDVVFVPPLAAKQIAPRFDLFCRAVWYMPGAVVLIEELSRVTSPSYAPAAWQNLSTAGRHRGITVLGTAQRPAQIDKDFLANCSEIRCFRLNYEPDAKAVASVLRVDWPLLLDLDDGHYFHRDIRARTTTPGILGGDLPAKTQKSGPVAKKNPPPLRGELRQKKAKSQVCQ